MSQTILTDVAAGIWLESFYIDSKSGPRLNAAESWSIRKRTLRGGPSDGVDVVTLNNGTLSVDILPTRGMGIWRGQCRDVALGWQSPVRLPIHPALVNLESNNGLGWLRGFNEWVCRCGLSSMGPPGIDVREDNSQSPVTLHGAIANTPAHYVDVSVSEEEGGTLAVRGIVDEASLFGATLRLESQIRTQAGSTTLEIVDQITNFGDLPAEMQLLYHANFGPPLLENNSRAMTATAAVAPQTEHAAQAIENWDRYTGPMPGVAEQVYLIEPRSDEKGRATIMLQNAVGDRAASISFPVAELPCLTVWKRLGGLNDGYVTGLEPSTSFPNPKTFERQQGRVVRLEPGETYRASLKITAYVDAQAVAAMVERIRQLQQAPPVLHAGFHPVFNPQVESKPQREG